MIGCLLAKLLGSHCWYFEIEIHNKTHNKGFRVSHQFHIQKKFGDIGFSWGSWGALIQQMVDSNNIYPGFKCALLILCKILWHILTFCLLLSSIEDTILYFVWRNVFHLHVTLYKGKRLFFISVFSVFLKRTLKRSIINNFLCMFFVNNKPFYWQQNFFAFPYSLFLMLYNLISSIKHKTTHCLI